MDDAPYLAPYGRHVFFCTGEFSEMCDSDGNARRLSWILGRELGELADYENPKRVKISTTPCLGVCMNGPLMVVYPEGIWYHHVDEDLIRRIAEEHLKGGVPVEDHIFHHLDQEPTD